MMKIGNDVLKPLTRSEIERIHAYSLDILENVGIKIMDYASLKILESFGVTIDYKEETAKFPSDLVEEMIKKAPKSFVLAARDAGKDIKVDMKKHFFATTNAIDIVEGRNARRITMKDLSNIIRIADALENVHFCLGTSVSDAPQRFWDVYQFRIMAENTTKHLRPVIASSEGAKIILKMAAVILGSEEALVKRPIVSVGYCSETPLRWGSTALKVFRETARYNLPVNIESEPLSGGTSPATLSGTIVLANAEVLSGIVLNQLYKEGRPCAYSIGFSHVLDFRSVQALSGSPETMLIAAAGAQLAHYYGLPSLSWVSSDSKIPDGQAAHEKALSFLVHVLSGNNLIWGVGSLGLQAALSLEQMIIDDEIIRMVQRIERGIEVTEETLGLDIIKSVGIGGTFLKGKKALRHVLNHYRSEHVQAKIDDRSSRFKWEEKGRRDMRERAEEQVRSILKSHMPTPLEKDVTKELDKIIRNLEKRKLLTGNYGLRT